MARQQTSRAGLDFITEREGYRVAVYKDSAGFPTVGVGHLLTSAEKAVLPVGTRISHEEVMAYLAKDVRKAENAIAKYVTVPLNQNQFDALASFTFNLGTGALAGSSLVTVLNHGEYKAAAHLLNRYVMAGGKRTAGLVTRRKAEEVLFNTPTAYTLAESPTDKAGGQPPDDATEAEKPQPPAGDPAIPPANPFPADPKNVTLPANTGGTQESVGLSWKLPSAGVIITIAWHFVQNLVTEGKLDVLEAAKAAADFLSANYKYAAGLAVGYLAIRKILSYVPTFLAWWSKTHKHLDDVTFTAAPPTPASR